MARSDKQESEIRARAVLALLAGEATLAETARSFGVAERELLLWRELYLQGARAQFDAPRLRRPWSTRARRVVVAGTALGLVTIAGVAASQSTWPITLITFTPDTPAVASEVNGNFAALKAGVEHVKGAVESKIGPVEQGGLMVDHPGAQSDLWLQGSTSTAPGNTRNLALLGDSQTDKLVVNVGAEYQGGVEVQSNTAIAGTLLARATTVSGNEIVNSSPTPSTPLLVTSGLSSLLMDGDEILVAGGATLTIQGDGSPAGSGGLTQLGGPLNVRGGAIINGTTSIQGSLTVQGTVESGSRYVVTARYDTDYPNGSVCTSNATIDMTVFQNLCSDVDGCSLSLIMKDYEPPAFRQDASIGPIHFEYDSTARVFRAADVPSLPGGDVSRTIGTDGNNVLEHALRAWNCFLTDSQHTPGLSPASADTAGVAAMYLLNFNANTGYRPDCVLVVDD